MSDFVPSNGKKDPSLTAGISNYTEDRNSADYKTRAFVFENESARISGQVVVNPNGSKTFKGIEIRPLDTDFNFGHKTWNLLLEMAREVARRKYDPENQGVSYDIPYRGQGRFDDPYSDRGIGRVYHPFTDSQLSAALQNPDNAPPGLLPSFTAALPPFIKEHLQYLDQTNGQPVPSPQTAGTPGLSSDKPVRTLSRANGNTSPAPAFEPSPPPARFVLPGPPNSSSGGLADWIAAMAGVDPRDPAQAAPSPQAGQLRGFERNDLAQPWFAPRQR